MGWKEFCRALFEHAEGQVFFQSLGNSPADNQHPRELISRNPSEIAPFLAKWDRPGRGMFVCVSTLKDGVHKRNKENVRQVTGLHADIDFKGLDLSETGQDPGAAGEASGPVAPGGLVREVVSRLLALPSPPSVIVNSGHGIHAYWLFHEPVDVADAPELVEQIERTLHLLADLVAGDPAVCEVSRLMRLPGTHNTKRGGRVPVEILHLSAARYELSDVEDMLSILSPIMRRKQGSSVSVTTKDGPVSDNPWLLAAQASGFKPPLDVEAMLSGMTLGGGPSGIHQTQVRVSAALLTRGHTVAEVTDLLLGATQRAAGEYGARWNWAREAKKIRQACEGWLRKHPQPEQNGSGAVMVEGAGDGEAGEAGGGPERTILPFTGTRTAEAAAGAGPSLSASGGHGAEAAGAHQGAPSTGEPAEVIPITQARTAAQAKKAAAPADKKDVPAIVVNAAIEVMAARGEHLLLTEGEIWCYRGGLWRVADAADEQRLRVMIQEGFKALGVPAKTGSLAQAWKHLTEHPDLYKPKVNWGSGKLICENGALAITDTGSIVGFEPHSPEHYAQRKLGAPYDPDATCPRVLEHLFSLFDGRADAADMVATLQEIAGMSIAPHLLGREGRKAFLGYGASRTGKTEFAELVRALICGEGSRVVSPSIKELSGEFGLQPLLGASAWIRDDAINEGDTVDPQKFKVVVTGEHVAVRRMRVLALDVQFCMPVILTTNALPRVRDQTDALFNRCLVVPFDRVVSPEEVRAWKAEHGCPASVRPILHLFQQERAGVLNWALEGLWRLLERGGSFEPPAAILDVMQRFKDDNNPVQEFARTALSYSAEHMVARADLMCAMHGWQREMEGDEARAFGARAFFPRLRAAMLQTADHKGHDGRRYIVGVRMTDEGLALWQAHNQGPQLRGGSLGASTEKVMVNRKRDGADRASTEAEF